MTKDESGTVKGECYRAEREAEDRRVGMVQCNARDHSHRKEMLPNPIFSQISNTSNFLSEIEIR